MCIRASLKLENAKFETSAATLAQCPVDGKLEIAFCGRSNAGKSSAINYLTSNKKLARTSKTPGRTQLINFFSISDEFRMVDLPGYGYAKVDETMRNVWAKLLERYLRERDSLTGVFLIMDIRHPMGKFDQIMLDYCESCSLSLHVLLNKSDKLSKSAAKKTTIEVRSELEGINGSVQQFSALKGVGLDEARQKLAEWLF